MMTQRRATAGDGAFRRKRSLGFADLPRRGARRLLVPDAGRVRVPADSRDRALPVARRELAGAQAQLHEQLRRGRERDGHGTRDRRAAAGRARRDRRSAVPEAGRRAATSHHAFVVQYQEGKDLGLDMHTDDSDVTFNVCLGKAFAGAGLTFCERPRRGRNRRAAPTENARRLPARARSLRRAPGRAPARRGRPYIGRATELDRVEPLDRVPLVRRVPVARRPGGDRAAQPECLSYTHDRDYRAHRRTRRGRKVSRKPRGIAARRPGDDAMTRADDARET